MKVLILVIILSSLLGCFMSYPFNLFNQEQEFNSEDAFRAPSLGVHGFHIMNKVSVGGTFVVPYTPVIGFMIELTF